MSSATLRFAKAIAIYSLLVVPPVAGLLAILHLGTDLHPPHAVGGDWLLAASPACTPFEGHADATLKISQSGLRAVGQLSHTPVALTIDGDAIAGEQVRTDGCHVAIYARLTGGELVGVMRWPGCTGCIEQPFRATRAPRRGAPR
jgi:hypothetical protein